MKIAEKTNACAFPALFSAPYSTEAQGRRFAQLLESLPIRISDPYLNSLWSNAVVVTREHGLSVYDGTYLDLAMREGVPIATRDKALRKAAKILGVNIL